MQHKSAASASPPDDHGDAGDEDADDWAFTRIVGKLKEAGDKGLTTTEITGRGRVGQTLRAELSKLLNEGHVRSASEGQGTRWFLAGSPA